VISCKCSSDECWKLYGRYRKFLFILFSCFSFVRKKIPNHITFCLTGSYWFRTSEIFCEIFGILLTSDHYRYDLVSKLLFMANH